MKIKNEKWKRKIKNKIDLHFSFFFNLVSMCGVYFPLLSSVHVNNSNKVHSKSTVDSCTAAFLLFLYVHTLLVRKKFMINGAFVQRMNFPLFLFFLISSLYFLFAFHHVCYFEVCTIPHCCKCALTLYKCACEIYWKKEREKKKKEITHGVEDRKNKNLKLREKKIQESCV